jgi:ubiquinone/menaquinone biosynthesis C-methylase UbiE
VALFYCTKMSSILSVVFQRLLSPLLPKEGKEWYELLYWKTLRFAKRGLGNEHYAEFYTSHFGLDASFYEGKRILDIGCGPCGSLEWANLARQRIGLDPLAGKYLKLGTARHRMTYVQGYAESIPFPAGSFDVVSAFNSLDHVDDVQATLREIHRVLERDAVFLLITDVGHKPTPFEPQEFSWDIVESLQPLFQAEIERHFERVHPRSLYGSLYQGVAYDHSDSTSRYGILSAKLKKR